MEEFNLTTLKNTSLAVNVEAPSRKFLAEIITQEDLNNIQPGKFNILAAPRGIGKTTFTFDSRILSFARDKKHIIYLVHTKNLRDHIHVRYPDITVAFTDEAVDGWFNHRLKGHWTSEEDVNKIHIMCYQTFAALLRRNIDWLDDIDLIVWDEFDDVQQYYIAEIKKAKKEFPDLQEERLAALLQEGKHTSIAAFIYQIQTFILEPARIRLLAISATPEAAAPLFGDYVNYIINGRLAEIYDAKETIYIESISAAVKEGLITPQQDMCPWVFTPRISDIMRLAEVFKGSGFNVLMMWSFDNPNWRSYVTEQQKIDSKIVNDTGLVPAPYNCVITNQVAGRGMNIYDTRFQDWLCDSQQYADIGQFIRARYAPQRKYLLSSAKRLIEFVREEGHFSSCYYTWHNKEELKELLSVYPIYDKTFEKILPSWNAVIKEWEDSIIFEDRRHGRNHIKQYRIVGIKKLEE